MNIVDRAQEIFAELRQLAFQNPLAAKELFADILKSEDQILNPLLDLAATRGNHRVRQIIARTVTVQTDTDRIIEHLLKWQSNETDEFTLTAIQDALATSPRSKTQQTPFAELPDLAFTYRYVAGRMRHRILNVLPRAGLSVKLLQNAISRIGGDELAGLLAPQIDDLRMSLQHLNQAVSYEDDEAYFAVRRLYLPDWLKRQIVRFSSTYGHLGVQLNFNDCGDKAWILASDYLLETIFTNLWMNVQQEVEDFPLVEMVATLQAGDLIIWFIDNGLGFTADDADRAFSLQFSTKHAENRGRGLMEVADAVRRLGAQVAVRPLAGSGYRVQLSFPRSEL